MSLFFDVSLCVARLTLDPMTLTAKIPLFLALDIVDCELEEAGEVNFASEVGVSQLKNYVEYVKKNLDARRCVETVRSVATNRQ